MKRIIISLIVAAAVVAGLIIAYQEASRERAREGDEEAPIAAPSRVQRTADGRTRVVLDATTQERLGLQVQPVRAATLPRDQEAYATVLDPTPLAALVADIASQQAAAEAAIKERDRLRALARNQIESARRLEQAEAAAQQAQVALEADRLKLLASWGKAVATQSDLAKFVQALAVGRIVLIRADMLVGEASTNRPVAVRVLLPDSGPALSAQLLGPAPQIEPEFQAPGYLLLATNTVGHLAPGLRLKARLQWPGDSRSGVIVPAAAVVRAAGQGWVYEQTDSTTFVRRPVPLTDPVPDGWFVEHGIAPNARLVVTGAQALLSEELKGQIRMVD